MITSVLIFATVGLLTLICEISFSLYDGYMHTIAKRSLSTNERAKNIIVLKYIKSVKYSIN